MKENYPRFYQSWLYKSIGLSLEQEIIPDNYIEPLYLLNKQWLKEDFDQEKTQWNTHEVMRSYTLYYMTMNMPKLWLVLGKNPDLLESYFSKKESVHLTEFGCGPGTFIWSYLFYLFINKPEYLKKVSSVRACDTSSEALAMAKTLWNNLRSYSAFKHIEMEFVEDSWQNLTDKPTDWIIFGNSLVEDKQVHLEKLKEIPADMLCIIEPGTSNHFQQLRKVRDGFIQDNWQVHFPCSQSTLVCPMKEDDWCHFHINRFQLPFIQHISSRAGRLNSRHNFSAFLLSKEKLRDESIKDWRIISQTRKAGRSHIRFICNSERIQETVLNRKDKSDENKDFGRWERGDLFEWNSDSKQDFKRIKEKDTLRKHNF